MGLRVVTGNGEKRRLHICVLGRCKKAKAESG